MTRYNKKRKFSFSVHLTSLCRAGTYLNFPFAVFPWGLLIPTLNSHGHFILFSLNIKPGVHRTGILGATSKRLCLCHRAAWSPAVEPYALSSSLPWQTLYACCLLSYTISLASLLCWEQQNMHLVHLIHFINMLSFWCLLQHRITEHFSPWITSQQQFLSFNYHSKVSSVTK